MYRSILVGICRYVVHSMTMDQREGEVGRYRPKCQAADHLDRCALCQAGSMDDSGSGLYERPLAISRIVASSLFV